MEKHLQKIKDGIGFMVKGEKVDAITGQPKKKKGLLGNLFGGLMNKLGLGGLGLGAILAKAGIAGFVIGSLVSAVKD